MSRKQRSAIDPQDSDVLRYAGLMGHEYACIHTRNGRRELRAEVNSLQSAEAMFEPNDKYPAIYRKVRKGWEIVQ